MKFEWKTFKELTLVEIYEILALRQKVFIVEQNCPYLDADGLDQDAWHFFGRENGSIAGYLRVLKPGVKYDEIAIGRVLTSPDFRKQGFGKVMMGEVLKKIETVFGKAPVRISAQLYLEKFYKDFGFVSVGEVYPEDGIPHIEMLRDLN